MTRAPAGRTAPLLSALCSDSHFVLASLSLLFDEQPPAAARASTQNRASRRGVTLRTGWSPGGGGGSRGVVILATRRARVNGTRAGSVSHASGSCSIDALLLRRLQRFQSCNRP